MTTRDKLLNYTASALQRKGFYGTGIREVLMATRIPKGSLYHHFPRGKAGMVRATLIEQGDRSAEMIKQSLKKKNPRKGLAALIDLYQTLLKDSDFIEADPFIHCALELQEDHPELVNLCHLQYDRWTMLIEKYLLERSVADPSQKARLFFASLQGAFLQCKIRRNLDALALLRANIDL